ncbi:Putative transposase, YhgA-like [Desulfonema limicola]|uniref:Transposase, YhgA-like n=1 Tax=Desulfonema limicola TaxID=45656 RepID=A0A975B965_9BACT|nr:Rpn family recombination-promoting nuclease/putative transposase [Desulfonema limicola]QTA81053.1 Putative transposase, YhgA-like [Desulfonema limicola]
MTEYLDQNPGAKCLPVIFPAVLYHGKTGWNSSRTLGSLIEGDDFFSEYMPDRKSQTRKPCSKFLNWH